MIDLGLGSWPARRARISPHAIALREADREVSYAELAARVDRLAAGLAELGVRAGDRVAYLGPNAIATFEALFAAGRLGAVFVPLNTRLAPPEIFAQLADCTPAVLIHAPELRPPDDGRAMLTVEEFSALADTPGDPPDEDVDLAQAAVILYTSGTTGRPKGVVLTHNNLTFNTINQLAHVDVLSTDVVLCTAPLFHAAGLGQVSLPTLFKGGTVVVAPRFDPGWLLEAVAEQRIRAFSAVPTMLQMLCEHPDWPAADLSSLRYVIYGGSPVVEWVARAWHARGVPILQGYGMTEAAPGALLAPLSGAADKPTSPGVPHFFTDIEIGQDGQLLVRGPNLSPGYWRRPRETAEAFHRGWFRSGDLVRLDDDGWATVLGRMTDMYISGGENVYPAEVEAALAELPGVAACAVVGVPHARWGEVGFALVVPRPDADLDEAAISEHLVARMARYKVPRYIRFVEDLPRTASGKVRKSELPALIPEENP
ncbi:long-chain fatty acid--CoA ligase [Luedemannella helvata]|uniref:Long-chain fatty acid--CoA ligase n=1 Tax=Luedemannella helvata TaxID=349315 RepID=A0ABN2L6H4_9ACTN